MTVIFLGLLLLYLEAWVTTTTTKANQAREWAKADASPTFVYS